MILVDTSVWIDHLRTGSAELSVRLEQGLVACHPFVVGELACGNLQGRAAVLAHLRALPQARMADHEEAIHLVTEHRLHGRGLGWIDVHLLASALLSDFQLWTLDQQLASAAWGLHCGV